MAFKDLILKSSYDSDEDDILEMFYLPVLSESIRYRRLAGFFSSTSLAVAARGINSFLRNEGQMEIIVGAKLSEEDVRAINEGTLEPVKVIAESSIRDLQDIKDEFIRDHVRALAWMVAKNQLRIKIAIPLDEMGKPLTHEQVAARGMFHQKVGVFLDDNDDMISFSGSINETAYAWRHNIEEFKVFRSWIPAESLYLETDLKKITKYWDEKAKNALVIDVPTAVRDKLVDMAPRKIEDIDFAKYSKKSCPRLRVYQANCASTWIQQKRGFLEMATGTGKTYAAIGCLNKLRQTEKHLCVVVTVPYVHLVSQWTKDFDDWNLSAIQAYGNSDSWTNRLMNELLDLNAAHSNMVIVITTHDTFSSEQFKRVISSCKQPILLIADEVHGLGSEQRRKGLIERYKFRIGLSATPIRWLDDEGTLVLQNYFGDTLFSYPLERAIEDGILVPYEYHVRFVNLTSQELQEYRDLTKRIAKQYYASKNDDERRRYMDLLRIQRQQIVVNAVNKIPEFIRIIEEDSKRLEYCLVYCSPAQIERVQRILNERLIIQHKFTANETKDEREQLLRSFAEGTYQTLVAMKCLDEGVNVPPTRTAIFLASSGNPKEFIQRRGRVLRRFENKEKAAIYDIIVVPSRLRGLEADISEIERNILIKELTRIREFASASLNPQETMDALEGIMKASGIAMKEVLS